MKNTALILISTLTLFSQLTFSAEKTIREKTHYTEMEKTLIQIFTPYAINAGHSRIKISTDYENTLYTGGVMVEDNMINIIFGSEFNTAYPNLPEDAYAKILCHELGHIFGETPAADQISQPISPEAESDYFASAVCLKKLFRAYPSRTIQMVDPMVSMNCLSVYKDAQERELCERIAMSGLNFFTALRTSLLKTKAIMSSDTFYAQPDFSKKETRYFDFYPSLQCRTETIAAGAYCDTSENLWSIGEKNWHCKSGIGARLGCWFKQ